MRSATSASRPRWNATASASPAMPPASDEQQALGQHLPQQPRRAGAERRAQTQLALAHGAAREQQVGDVDAGDQQHERDRAGEHEQRRANLLDHLLVNRHERHRPAGIALRRFLLELRRDRSSSRRRPAASETPSRSRAMPCDDPRPGACAQPLERPAVRNHEVGALPFDRESRRHDADDGARPAVGGERRAEHVGAAAEPRLPELVAETG